MSQSATASDDNATETTPSASKQELMDTLNEFEETGSAHFNETTGRILLSVHTGESIPFDALTAINESDYAISGTDRHEVSETHNWLTVKIE